MNKTVRGILIVATILLLGAALIFQERKVSTTNDVMGAVADSLRTEQQLANELQRKVAKLTERNEELEKINANLTKQNRALRDSVKMLNNRIVRLNKQLRDQTTRMVTYRKTIDSLKYESDRLISQINSLQTARSVNEKEIEELDKKRAELDKKVGELFMANDSLERSLLDTVVVREEVREDFKKKEKILDIISQVKVVFTGISPRKDNDKETKNPKKWEYTLINMNLAYPDSLLSGGEEFLVKIINKTTGEVVSPRESNAGRDQQGMKFVFTENPAPEIKYINYQDKEKHEFMVQVYFIKDGNEYPLAQGSSDIPF